MDLIGLTLRQVENLTGEACWQKYGVDILGRVPNSMAKRIIQKADFSFLLRENKQYCFNGKVKFVMINSDRNSDQPTKADYFDRSFNWLDFRWGYEHSRIKPEKPHDFEKMIEIAEKLSQNMKHVRIDLYYCANKIAVRRSWDVWSGIPVHLQVFWQMSAIVVMYWQERPLHRTF